MNGIRLKTLGKLESKGERAALLISQNGKTYILRLAYVLRGTDARFFPESVLDDWGHEISGSELYQWVRENEVYFPRAELFGHDIKGKPRQCFLRELDLAAGLPLYVFEEASAPLNSGLQVHAILLVDKESSQRQLSVAPARISYPLRGATVEWWLVNTPEMQSGDLDLARILDG